MEALLAHGPFAEFALLLMISAVVGAIALLGTGVASATQVEWQECTEMLGIEAEYVPAGLECGTVEVPVDYNAPDAAIAPVTYALARSTASPTSAVCGRSAAIAAG